MRRHAHLGMLVHIPGPDLHFQAESVRSDNRGVQALVIVTLRLRDVIIELAGYRRPQLVHQTQHAVAGGDIIDQHADGTDIVKPFEIQILALHLFPDAGDVLRPSGDIGGNPGPGQRRLDLLRSLLDVTFAQTAFFLQLACNGLILLRLHDPERQILQFPFQLPDTESVGERRMDIGGQVRQGQPLGFRPGYRFTHLHQLPGQQHDQHAQIQNDGQ